MRSVNQIVHCCFDPRLRVFVIELGPRSDFMAKSLFSIPATIAVDAMPIAPTLVAAHTAYTTVPRSAAAAA